MKLDPSEVRRAAEADLQAEAWRRALDAEKERLRHKRPWWHRLFPWTVTIKRRT